MSVFPVQYLTKFWQKQDLVYKSHSHRLRWRFYEPSGVLLCISIFGKAGLRCPAAREDLSLNSQKAVNLFLVRARGAQPVGDTQHSHLAPALLPGSTPAELAGEHPARYTWLYQHIHSKFLCPQRLNTGIWYYKTLVQFNAWHPSQYLQYL